MNARQRLWQHFGTPAAIYGTIVYASLIAASGLHLDPDDAVLPVLVFSSVTIVVFWIAHIFAFALARHGDERVNAAGPWASTKHAFNDATGMLEAALVLSVPLILGTLGLMQAQRSVQASLIVGVATLAVLGFLAFTPRHTQWWLRIAGAFGTALLGVAIIVIEALLH
jgi:hypothetical protein